MDMIIQPTDRIGDIVASYPNTAEVFKQFRIDFCCGGNKPLQQVMQEHNIDQDALMERLGVAATARTKAAIDWTALSSGALIDHIIRYHHEYLRTTLPTLSGYVKKVAHVHGPHHRELFQVYEWFETLREEMMQHMEKEEKEDFPAVLAYETDPSEAKREQLLSVLDSLKQEHEQSGDLLKKIRAITQDYTLPEDACTTFQLTYAKLQELEADMFQHIHLENNILFQRT